MITSLCVQDSNLSYAWAKTFLSLMERGGSVRHPAIVTIGPLEGAEVEHQGIRKLLDDELTRCGESSCRTVANTIFPRSMWNDALANNADALYARYAKAWPGIRKCPANRNGVYFRRLTAYCPIHPSAKTTTQHKKEGTNRKEVNQLQFITQTYQRGNHRKSALQATVLDPTRDLTHQRQKGFPCLQQIAFTPLENDRLSITGFYATQYHFEKAYGNYLGLYWLGQFMAHQLKLRLTQVVCIAAVLELGVRSKNDLQALEIALKPLMTHGSVALAHATPLHRYGSSASPATQE